MPLAVCATPIGNLEDVTLRVLRELAEADLVLCEDTRRTRTLLSRHGISAKLLSYHEHNEAKRTAELLPRLVAGERMALVSDAGLPGISDPGKQARRGRDRSGRARHRAAGRLAPWRRRSSPAAFAFERYQFVGYLPRGATALAALWDELAGLASRRRRVRVAATPAEDARVARRRRCRSGRSPCARELTKAFEEVVRGVPADVLARFREPPKGEITLVLAPAAATSSDAQADEAAAAVAELVAAGLSRRDAAELVSRLTSIPRGRLYRRSL